MNSVEQLSPTAYRVEQMGSGVFSVNIASERSRAKNKTTDIRFKTTKEKTPDPFVSVSEFQFSLRLGDRFLFQVGLDSIR